MTPKEVSDALVKKQQNDGGAATNEKKSKFKWEMHGSTWESASKTKIKGTSVFV